MAIGIKALQASILSEVVIKGSVHSIPMSLHNGFIAEAILKGLNINCAVCNATYK
jgi:hypothetical protein